MSKARELAELSRTVADSADAVAITVDSNENTTFTGVVTANAGVVVDNITIDGTTLALSSGDLTLDVAGNLLLNADGGGIYFQDASLLVGSLQNSSSDLLISAEVADKDIIFRGIDSSTTIDALKLDMSEAGAATFSAGITATTGTFSGNVGAGGATASEKLVSAGTVRALGTTLTSASSATLSYTGTTSRLESRGGDVSTRGAIELMQATSNGSSEIVALGFNAAGAATFNSTIAGTSATFTTADNLPQLTLISTDADANAGPLLVLDRQSASPADGDVLGQIQFNGKNDAAEAHGYAKIEARIVDASNATEDGRLELMTSVATEEGISRILMNATETVINDNSKDLDFRVESDTNSNMLHVDAGNNGVGIGTAGTTTPLTVNGGTASAATIQLGNHGDNASIHAKYNLAFKADSTEAIADRGISFGIGAGASLGLTTADAIFNELGADMNFRVESDGNTHMLFVDGGVNGVGIGTSDRISSPLTIQSSGAANAISIIGRDNGASDEAVISFFEYDGTTRNAYIIKEAGQLVFVTGTGGAPVEKLRLGTTSIIVNETGVNQDFRVESADNEYALFVDGGNNDVISGVGTTSRNAALSDKRAGTTGLQLNKPGLDDQGGHLFMTQTADVNTWITICSAHDVGATGLCFLIHAVRAADQNRSYAALVRYAYQNAFNIMSVNSQNATVEYRVSGTSIQYRLTTAGPYIVNLTVMAAG